MDGVVIEHIKSDYESSLVIRNVTRRQELKRCTNCGASRSLEEFSRNRSKGDGLDLHCRECIRRRIRDKKARQLAQGLCTSCGAPRGESRSRWCCQRCLTRDSGTRRSREMRTAVLHAYGGESPACTCCGQNLHAFLTLDHINNGGRAHRRQKGNQGVYHELRRAGYPPGYQILCFNCNIARGCYGLCPHDRRDHPGTEVFVAINSKRTGSRVCTRCKVALAETEFYPDKIGPGGLQSRCRSCTREASIERLRAARHAALVHYSGGDICCQCCGQREEEFLALDHINGEGPRHPTRRSGGNSFYAWLKKQGYPSGLGVLCHNCNCAKGRDRPCPHTLVTAA